MDGSRAANVLADLVSRRDDFHLVVAGCQYHVFPSMIYIPGLLFDQLHAALRGVSLPEAERRVRRSTDEAFLLNGYFHQAASLLGSPKSTLVFMASTVDAIGY